MAPNDPNSDEAEPMGRGLAILLVVIGAGLAAHFGMKLETAIEEGANPLGLGYVAVFVLVGMGLMVLGLKNFHDAGSDGADDPDQR